MTSLRQIMTPDQIAEAQRRVREMVVAVVIAAEDTENCPDCGLPPRTTTPRRNSTSVCPTSTARGFPKITLKPLNGTDAPPIRVTSGHKLPSESCMDKVKELSRTIPKRLFG